MNTEELGRRTAGLKILTRHEKVKRQTKVKVATLKIGGLIGQDC